jgi:hypothetical protein
MRVTLTRTCVTTKNTPPHAEQCRKRSRAPSAPRRPLDNVEWTGTTAAPGLTPPSQVPDVEVEPPRRVVFTWGVAGKDSLPPGSTTVEVVLTADGSDTVVELFHHNLPAEEFDSHLRGMDDHARAARAAFEVCRAARADTPCNRV